VRGTEPTLLDALCSGYYHSLMRTYASSPRDAALRSVLDLDPDLADGLGDEDRRRARQAFTGRLRHVAAGRWELPSEPATLGYLIVDGIVCRETPLVTHRSLELLGAGDVIRPAEEPAWPQLGHGVIVTAITDTEAIALGPAFIRAAAQWPSVLVAIHRRLDAQRARLAMQGLITHLPRAEDRLVMVLWHLASRWGRVTPDGVVVPLRLTHDLLGQLIAARRSTVTLAVRTAERHGRLLRRHDGSWVLTTAGENAVLELTSPGPPRSNSETLMRRQRAAPARRPPAPDERQPLRARR
jgi:CRP/FNR family cyclic AMP-dependent transcriptional regulator